MDKNGVLAWATIIMIVVGLALIGLGAFRYDDVARMGVCISRNWFFCHCMGIQCIKRKSLVLFNFKLPLNV